MPSRVIHGMLYSAERRTLDVVFRNSGETYRYFDVTPEEWSAFKRAPSKGTHLNAIFKDRHPRFERVDGLQAVVGTGGEAGAGHMPRDLPDQNVWGFYEHTL